MPFKIVHNDIVNMQVDAIVNIDNQDLKIETDLDQEIYGKAVIMPGFNLAAKYVIHTAIPVLLDSYYQEESILTNCYCNVLNIAKENNCKSIAIPLIITNSFPKDIALQIAINEISSFLTTFDMNIYLVVSDIKSFKLSEKLLDDVNSYINENYIQDEFGGILPIVKDVSLRGSTIKFNDLEDLLNELDAGFSETLLKLIDQTGKKDSEIYKKANVDRKLFSKIRNNKNYKPSKTTAIAFAFALELDLEQTKDFIARAGYALSHSSKFDVIVEYFLVNNNYNIFELNEVLFAFDQPLIGS